MIRLNFRTATIALSRFFSRDFFAQREGWGHHDDSPILILGLPRSGSTLLEQILASHSQVEGTAELHYLLRAATHSGINRSDGIRYPQVMHEFKAHHLRGIGEEYIENTLKHRSDRPHFTDKMPQQLHGHRLFARNPAKGQSH